VIETLPMTPASGEQTAIEFGDQRAVVVEVGGGLRTYTVGGLDVIDGYTENEVCSSGRGQVLIPWPNRIEDGTYEFGNKRHQLPLNEQKSRNAIHGLVRWSSWTVAERQPHRVAMEYSLHPQPGYPFSLGLRLEYELTEKGLSVSVTATNLGEQPCPYGAGAHPYVRLGEDTVDTLALRSPARTVLCSDDRGIPIGSRSVEGTEYDFYEPRSIGRTILDHAFTDLKRDAEGLSRLHLSAPGGGETEVSLWVDEGYGYLMLFTGDPLPDVNRRSLAIEPMTCAPNAFRSGDGLLVLDPGQSFTATWGITPILSPMRS
jgi:aldose 1-epimerase